MLEWFSSAHIKSWKWQTIYFHSFHVFMWMLKLFTWSVWSGMNRMNDSSIAVNIKCKLWDVWSSGRESKHDLGLDEFKFGLSSNCWTNVRRMEKQVIMPLDPYGTLKVNISNEMEKSCFYYDDAFEMVAMATNTRQRGVKCEQCHHLLIFALYI